MTIYDSKVPSKRIDTVDSDGKKLNESDKAYYAFKTYRGLSHNRSHLKVCELTDNDISTIQTWSSKFKWNERIKAEDNIIAEKELEVKKELVKDTLSDTNMIVRHNIKAIGRAFSEYAKRLQDQKFIQQISKSRPTEFVKAIKDLTDSLEKTQKIMLVGNGEATEITRNENSDKVEVLIVGKDGNRPTKPLWELEEEAEDE